MRLASVLELKEKLLSSPRVLMERVATAMSFRAFVGAREAAATTMAGIALGVAPAKKGYSLAVRLQESGPLVSAMTENIRHEARDEVDVQYVGNIVKFAKHPAAPRPWYQQRRRPLRIGSSVSDVHTEFDSAGTLGCFVMHRKSPQQIGLLTNNHVIANENRNPLETPVVQPGTLDGGNYPADQVAELVKFVRLRRRATNYVDAAIADLDEGIRYNTRQIGNLGDLNGQGNVVDLPANAIVHKVGRTTGQTQGRVTAFDVDNVHVRYDMGVLRFDSQIEIEGAGRRAFSEAGDSGSLIVDEDLKAIGLLFAGGDQGGSNNKGLTYANPIELVLNALTVEINL
jgi:S1-C subfamily serine protease